MGKSVLKLFILYCIGGLLYYCIELLWRGYSHGSMFVVGGLCFVLVGNINEYYSWNVPLWKQCLIATLIIIIIEFLAGCIINLWIGLNIWHYTQLDVLGQISLAYMLLWFPLSGLAILLDDALRWKLFGEEKPKYILF